MLDRMRGVHLEGDYLAVLDHFVLPVSMAFLDQSVAQIEVRIDRLDHRLNPGAGRRRRGRPDLVLLVEEIVSLPLELQMELVSVAGHRPQRLRFLQGLVLVEQAEGNQLAFVVDSFRQAESNQNPGFEGSEGFVAVNLGLGAAGPHIALRVRNGHQACRRGHRPY